jgi:serine/threonine protein kinase
MVVLRVLCEHLARDTRQIELFYLEAEAAAKLNHKNIVRASRAICTDGIHLMAIEHKPAMESLYELLSRRGWLDPSLAVRITCQVAAAIDYAHGLDVLHLNLQPQSILLDSVGNVLVTDFGIHRRDDLDWARSERSSRILPYYVSPEQAKGERVGQSSDIYSLGVLLFEMLTDRLPFNAESQEAIKRKHIMQAPLQPQLFRSSISRPLSEITIKLLEKKPGGRIQTGKGVISLLGMLHDVDRPAATVRVEEKLTGISVEDARFEPLETQSGNWREEPLNAPEPEPIPEPEGSREPGKPENPITALSREIARPEEEAELAKGESEDREPDETPAIAVIDYPVRQFHENTFAYDAVSNPRGSFLQQPTALASTPGRRFPWYSTLIIGAFVIATGVLALARADSLQGIFSSQTAERGSGPLNQEPLPSQALSPSEVTKAQPVQTGEERAPPSQVAQVAASSVTGAAVRAEKPRVKESSRRSKNKSWKYRLRRRARQ